MRNDPEKLALHWKVWLEKSHPQLPTLLSTDIHQPGGSHCGATRKALGAVGGGGRSYGVAVHEHVGPKESLRQFIIITPFSRDYIKSCKNILKPQRKTVYKLFKNL